MRIILYLSVLVLGVNFAVAQQLIELPVDGNPEVSWKGDAKTYFSSDWNTCMVGFETLVTT